MVTAKDVLVAGTVLTGAANLVGWVPRDASPQSIRPSPKRRAILRRDHRRGRQPSLPADHDRLNRTFALLGVAATPFINFALFDSYHPHPVRSFSLW